ncbi:MAG: Mobile element protein, partial [uncultured Rubrobacteraceae bacterium]
MKLYGFIEAQKANHSVSLICRVLGIARSGYYAWRGRAASSRAVADASITEKIRSIHRESRGTYGYLRVHAQLRSLGISAGRKRIARLMRAEGLAGCRVKTFVRTTRRDLDARPVADLVGRRFISDGPDLLWVADLTYVPTGEGWMYLAFVLDVYSRKIVGWSMAEHMRAELVVSALGMAVSMRKPGKGLIHHSDRGAQYTSVGFGERLQQAGILPSMGSVGTAYDNAMAESFVATLKTELLHRGTWPTREAARISIFEYIECFYNPLRRHGSLGYLS